MSRTDSAHYSLSLRHLSRDGKVALASLPDARLSNVSEQDLLKFLRAVAATAASVELSAEPEIRIDADGAPFVVRVRGGELHLVSWSAAHKGGVVTPEQIVTAVTGREPRAEAMADLRRMATPGATRAAVGKIKEKMAYVGLTIAILGLNAFTIWMLTRPPRTLTVKYRLLDPVDAKRTLEEVAGVYETGKEPGDRRIEVKPDATMQRMKFGSGGVAKDRQTYTVQPADALGKKALVTNRKSLVQVRDPASLVLYGDTYVRVGK